MPMRNSDQKSLLPLVDVMLIVIARTGISNVPISIHDTNTHAQDCKKISKPSEFTQAVCVQSQPDTAQTHEQSLVYTCRLVSGYGPLRKDMPVR